MPTSRASPLPDSRAAQGNFRNGARLTAHTHTALHRPGRTRVDQDVLHWTFSRLGDGLHGFVSWWPHGCQLVLLLVGCLISFFFADVAVVCVVTGLWFLGAVGLVWCL